MTPYFAVGDASTAIRLLAGRRALLSFAYLGTGWLPKPKADEIVKVATGVMLDSGAFTIWRKGGTIDVERYEAWVTEVEPEWWMALDIIGDGEKSVVSWRGSRARTGALAARLVPVWHEGDPIEHLDEYVAHAETLGGGLVALGRLAGRRSEQKTWEFYDAAFNRHPTAKYHALGNANPVQLEPYPFASFDSTGWQRDAAYTNAARWPFNRCAKETRLRAYIEATESITYRQPKQTVLFGRA